MNPFDHVTAPRVDLLEDWEKLWPDSYDKRTVDPYTRTRIILMNGTEFENVWFSHQASRHMQDQDVRRELALMRRGEQQQQKALAHLKPADESMMEHTIGYEQLAVDLTAHLAKRVTHPGVKDALDFALLEDFDHLYRYADYMDMHEHVKAENLVGGYTEIMPGRPTVAHHRFPYDSIRFPMTDRPGVLIDCLAAQVITAAEQQTMNYYMNTCALYPEETGRKLYAEIGMVEEQHVSQYGSLLNPHLSWLENLLVHQYTECWLYWSCAETETVPHVKKVWKWMLEQELMHLHIAQELLEKKEDKHWQQVLGQGEFPEPLKLESNIPYVRQVLRDTVCMTAQRENYVDVHQLDRESSFAQYQQRVNTPLANVISHGVIEDYIRWHGQDYRFETAPHPIPDLQCRTCDNTQVGRV